MRFRPCIDIHNGKVKQIVGSSLDDNKGAKENFVSKKDASEFALMYKRYGLFGGHVIILDPVESPHYEGSKNAAFSALKAYNGGLMAGGGINDENAAQFLDAGASHVIVTSFVFKNGILDRDNLSKLEKAVGRKRLCLDLSCKKRDGKYFVVTDRWQKFTELELSSGLLCELSEHCSEFLVHAADVEGKRAGIEEEVVEILKGSPIPATYAGGIKDLSDMERIRALGDDRVDATVGSALSLFGGSIDLEELIMYNK